MNAPRVPVGSPVFGCVEVRPKVSLVRHVGGLLTADGRHDHDTSHRISRARRMIGLLTRSWAKGQKDRRGRASALSLPLRLRLMKARVDPIFDLNLIFADVQRISTPANPQGHPIIRMET